MTIKYTSRPSKNIRKTSNGFTQLLQYFSVFCNFKVLKATVLRTLPTPGRSKRSASYHIHCIRPEICYYRHIDSANLPITSGSTLYYMLRIYRSHIFAILYCSTEVYVKPTELYIFCNDCALRLSNSFLTTVSPHKTGLFRCFLGWKYHESETTLN